MTTRTCLRCGSDQIIPNVPLADKYGEWGGLSEPLQVKLHGNPTAWLFKDTAAGQLVAFICGACGHTELKAQGFQTLYQKYLETQGEQPGPEPTPNVEAEAVTSVVCLSCGQKFPRDWSRCPNCGWTWEE